MVRIDIKAKIHTSYEPWTANYFIKDIFGLVKCTVMKSCFCGEIHDNDEDSSIGTIKDSAMKVYLKWGL